MSWRKSIALAVPLVVVAFTLGVVVGLELARGPDWQLELEEYVTEHTYPSDTLQVLEVARAREPGNFSAPMGIPQAGDWINPSNPAQDVRCVLLGRSGASVGDAGEGVRQVVYLVHHSDALYRVGWLAYAGPVEPFDEALRSDLASIGCQLALD
jgi:hypothetical protein